MWYVSIMLNIILLKYFVDNKYIYPLLSNFSYRQADHINKMLEKNVFFTIYKKRFNKIFVFAFFLHYIIVKNLEANVFPNIKPIILYLIDCISCFYIF